MQRRTPRASEWPREWAGRQEEISAGGQAGRDTGGSVGKWGTTRWPLCRATSTTPLLWPRPRFRQRSTTPAPGILLWTAIVLYFMAYLTVVKEKGYLNYFIKLFIQRFSYIPKLHTTKGGKNESIIPSQKKIYKYTCDIPKKKSLSKTRSSPRRTSQHLRLQPFPKTRIKEISQEKRHEKIIAE